MSIDITKLHPNWRELHAAHISQLEQMVKDNGPQSGEARSLLTKAVAEYEAIIKAVDEATWGKPKRRRVARDPSSGRPYASRSEQQERYEFEEDGTRA